MKSFITLGPEEVVAQDWHPAEHAHAGEVEGVAEELAAYLRNGNGEIFRRHVRNGRPDVVDLRPII